MIEFKELEIKPQGNWFKRILQNHYKKTALYIVAGALIGLAFYYITEGVQRDTIPTSDVLRSVFLGAFLGFFLTNSPCARNKC